ncbi:MAG TPA: TetR family transcriptional regulator [Streptosporangiaceae bacterium]|nr:TetR family transcriptional regulator [Streptosporangiaceae bacterium]
MAEPRQAGTLARTHEGQPGLPRGRSSLPQQDVRASQRQRLLRSAIAVVSESGYQQVIVADIVRRAKVSRGAFYEHFANKEECFLAATAEGRELMLARVVSEARAMSEARAASESRAASEASADAAEEDLLRGAIRGFLAFLRDEPAFARVFYLHMPAAGEAAARRLDAGPRIFANLNRTWHGRGRKRHPEWPVLPDEAYLALAGSTVELVRSLVYADRTEALPELEDTVVALHLTVMTGRPWPAVPS